jgi:hypothetical protein
MSVVSLVLDYDTSDKSNVIEVKATDTVTIKLKTLSENVGCIFLESNSEIVALSKLNVREIECYRDESIIAPIIDQYYVIERNKSYLVSYDRTPVFTIERVLSQNIVMI